MGTMQRISERDFRDRSPLEKSAEMTLLLKIEELSFFFLAIFLFSRTGYAWWWFPLLLFVPDAGMAGYLLNTRIGALLYNFVHHRAVAIAVYTAGAFFGISLLELGGCILFAHASLDRVFNYGLKYPDRFTHTHLN